MPPAFLFDFYYSFYRAQSLGHRGHNFTFFQRLIITQFTHFFLIVLDCLKKYFGYLDSKEKITA